MTPSHLLISTLLFVCLPFSPALNRRQDISSENILIGLLQTDSDGHGYATQMENAARLCADYHNAKGGIDGSQVELIVEACQPTRKGIQEAIGKLTAAGALGVIAPLEQDLAKLTKAAALGKLPCLTFSARPESIREVLIQHVKDSYRCTKIAFAHDKSKEAKDLIKWMKKEMPSPCTLVLDFDFRIKPKSLKKKLDKTAAQILVIQGGPDAVATFLQTTWSDEPLPTLLTPQCFGTALRSVKQTLRILQGRSPMTVDDSAWFFDAYRSKYKDPAFGAAEGFEAMSVLLHAIDAADSHERTAISKALKGRSAEGARGTVVYDKKALSIDPPLGLWRIEGEEMEPYLPSVIPENLRGKGTSSGKQPDPTFGEPIGKRRVHQFEFEPDTLWVLFTFRGKQRSTIDDDLKKLKLSTDGDNKLLDQLVKDELMARILSITSVKFLRNPDGTAIPGKSYKISLAARLPDKRQKMKKPKTLWRAFVAGDDTVAGGRAFGDYCQIFSIFIRRTIFQEHALTPGLADGDLIYLDGTYRFGTDPIQDKRSELIRALINGYAGAMALTAAHEIGHMCGCGHVLTPETAIMNAAEGAGIDYRDGDYCKLSMGILERRLGIAGTGKKRKRR